VIEVNVALTSEPGLINTSPDAEGWIFKIAPDAPAELETLLDDAAYAKHTA
jgi:glycine cleavage system H protein